MPVSKYFKGHGTEVMKKMKEEYGDKKGESVFYATSNKNKAAADNATEYMKGRKRPSRG